MVPTWPPPIDLEWETDTRLQGAKYAFVWAGTNVLCFFFFFFCMPELKGRSLEEIDELFERQVPAWKFKSARTTTTDEALREIRSREAKLQGKMPVELVEEREKV